MHRDMRHLRNSAMKEKQMDIHTRLISKYKQVPEWWFVCIPLTSISTTIFTCEFYDDQLQLPSWGVLLGCAIAIFFTLPIGIIAATTNQLIPASLRVSLFALQFIKIEYIGRIY